MKLNVESEVEPFKIDLTQRKVQLNLQEWIKGFRPALRFGQVYFDDYIPDSKFPSQLRVREVLRQFTRSPLLKRRKRFLFSKIPQGQGYYLDGGFGVGKTHLLAATWHAFGGKKAFLSFVELIHTIGLLGLAQAVDVFGDYDLLCIDEFELDDPGNTHMAHTFLSQLIQRGVHVVTTSNTQPSQLGQGRFNSEDFKQQISGIAKRFETLTLEGFDHRQKREVKIATFQPSEMDGFEALQVEPYIRLSAVQLHQHLTQVHPVLFGQMLYGIQTLLIDDLTLMEDQSAALRYVHFIDKVYDLGLSFATSGTHPDEIFDITYRFGAFQKKYSRCISRSKELFLEMKNKKMRTT